MRKQYATKAAATSAARKALANPNALPLVHFTVAQGSGDKWRYALVTAGARCPYGFRAGSVPAAVAAAIGQQPHTQAQLNTLAGGHYANIAKLLAKARAAGFNTATARNVTGAVTYAIGEPATKGKAGKHTTGNAHRAAPSATLAPPSATLAPPSAT